MRRIRCVVFLISMVVASTPAAAETEELASQILMAHINESREELGLPPLRYEPRLARIARTMARALADGEPELPVPTRLREAGYPFLSFAARAEASGLDASGTAADWRTDPSARVAFESDVLREVGIARINGSDGKLQNLPANIWAMVVAAPARPAESGWRTRVVRYVNEFRSQYELPPLTPDSVLHRAAQAHANDMVNRDYFQHTNPEGGSHGDRAKRVGYDYQLALENLAAGQPTARDVVNAWIASTDGHREAMLNPDVTEAGIGYAFAPFDGGRVSAVHYWAMTLARPR